MKLFYNAYNSTKKITLLRENSVPNFVSNKTYKLRGIVNFFCFAFPLIYPFHATGLFKRSGPKVFSKKDVLENFAKFTRQNLCQTLPVVFFF